jgi:uncharacterized protein (TIGR02118 family)
VGLPPELTTSLGRLHEVGHGWKDLGGLGIRNDGASIVIKVLVLRAFDIAIPPLFAFQVSQSESHLLQSQLILNSSNRSLLINMSGYQVIVVYPRKGGSLKFDKDYYLKTHMPLAAKTWKKHGLKSYAVTELNEDNEYGISVVLEFESAEGWGAAVADANTKAVMDDVPNFSNEGPVLLHGGVISRESV